MGRYQLSVLNWGLSYLFLSFIGLRDHYLGLGLLFRDLIELAQFNTYLPDRWSSFLNLARYTTCSSIDLTPWSTNIPT